MSASSLCIICDNIYKWEYSSSDICFSNLISNLISNSSLFDISYVTILMALMIDMWYVVLKRQSFF